MASAANDLLGLMAGRSNNNGEAEDKEKKHLHGLFDSSESEDGEASDFCEEKLSQSTSHIENNLENSTETDENFAEVTGGHQDLTDSDSFGDEYEEDLMGDEEDRQRLLQMPELEREKILFDREQERLLLQERKALTKKLSALEASQTQKDRSSRRSISEAAAQKKRSLEALKAARLSKEQNPTAARQRRRQREDSDEDYYEEENFPKKSSTKNVSESKHFDLKSRQKLSESEDESVKNYENLTLEDAQNLQIGRDDVCRLVFHPEFDNFAKGCFMRLSIGMRGPEQVYRLVELKKIVPYHRTYQIHTSSNTGTGTTTNKAAILKYGLQEKTFRLDIISNSIFTPAEFQRWIETMKEEKQPILTHKTAHSRATAWKNFKSTPLSDQTVETMIKAKKELGGAPRSVLAERAMLNSLKIEALENGNSAEVSRIDEELSSLDKASERIESLSSSSTLNKLNALSQKNRSHNIGASKLNNSVNSNSTPRNGSDTRLDPFMRRKCQPSTFLHEDSDEKGTTTPSREEEKKIENEIKTDEKKATHNISPGDEVAPKITNAILAHQSIDLEIDI